MRVRSAAICLTAASLLAGCAQKPAPPPEMVAPNPFGYLKRSAVCDAGPVRHAPDGLAASMKTRSDDGFCSVSLGQPEGGAYASFLLSTLPMHGDSFIYNYNKHTIVTYTASTAYAGPDSFTVSLVPGGGRPRVPLRIDVAVNATGVAPPAPPAPTPSAKPASRHPTRRHGKAARHTTKHP